uniref:Usher syndrome 2A (autosomal recessive, mild) n=1 Tax=Poecilia mexicana TaxID=48701 RepID=A0A3B3X6F7_9TELE
MQRGGEAWVGHYILLSLYVQKISLTHFLLLLQGHFPRMENIAAFKPVSTSPPRSTCGVPEQSSYCQSPSSRDELHLCFQAMCVQECPYRSSTPPYAPLLLAAHSVLFQPSEDGCLVTPPSQAVGPRGSLTLAVWLKPSSTGEMMLLEKSSDNRLVFSLTVSERAVALRYGRTDGLTSHTVSFRTEGRLQLNRWTHLTLQVRNLSGSNQFIGQMQDFRFYPATLTNREIVQLHSGVLPKLHVQSECRCPPSHPRVHPLVERYCIPNAVEDTTNDRVLRLNLNAHPLSYVNDQDMGTMWLSKVMSLQELDEGVTITVDLANGQYQVFYVIVQFGGLLPESVLIQRRKLDLLQREIDNMTEQSWLDWQYMARNCNVFNMQNNGPLPRPDSVNCLQLPSDVPLVGGNITFSLLTTQPHLRPGYNDFYKTPALQEVVQAAQVRIHMKGQYYTAAVGVNQRHRHFAISEITISGSRCECHGHADQCDTSVTPYRCLCLPESHTVGSNCEHCAPLYNDKPFRSGDQLQPMNCRLCQCYGHAVSCHYDALADEHPDEHYRGGGGVCDHCMHNTSGKNCERCVGGFFRLQDSDPTSARVCQPCDCDVAGTVEGDTECPSGGQCECKPGVGGQRCDSCGRGLYGLRLEGSCAPCNCSRDGTVPGSNCDPHTGQCVCKEHVEGHHCDSCRHGYHTLEQRNSLGCLPCVCDSHGTVPEGVCDRRTGQCPCKEGVEGAHCTSCVQNYYNRSLDLESKKMILSDLYHSKCFSSFFVFYQGGFWLVFTKGLSQGCVPCICDPRGTVTGSTCDSATGQCVCIPSRHGKDCSSCRPGFYLAPDHGVCLECDCHPMGAMQLSCESQNGQCVCAHRSVGGRRCDQCREMFFGFNPGLGRCQPCACDPEGSVNSSCDPDTGVCVCKLLVTGDKCDSCQPGASHFDPENPFGCSKSPSQQPAPIGSVLSYSSIHLSWHPPDSPNSHRLNYTLMRDGQSLHTIQSHFPFSLESFVDAGLFPFTNYSYWLITANIAGETISASASYQTLGAPPSGEELHLNLLGRPGPTSASFNWSIPRNDTGPVERFVLSSVESSDKAEPVIHYTGLSTEAVASDLKAFIQYSVTLEACSSGGCTSSPPLYFLTATAPPQNQSAPNITATGPHTLHASWVPPSQPNGILPCLSVLTLVFSSSGWLDPSVLPEQNPTKTTTLSPPESSTIIEGLQAFSAYQLRVVSINSAGNVTSEWTTAHTLEGAPEFVAPPDVSALSSSTLSVTSSMKNIRYDVEGLKPYHTYNFTVTLCTRMGCITSLPSTGRTLPAVPTGLSSPRLHPVNETTIQIDWDPPGQLNGPSPLYQLSFKTWSPNGLLLSAFSPGHQEEFLAIQIKNGRPYFLFDPQGSAVAVGVHGDGNRRYNDGQWHNIVATRQRAVGTITINHQYSGSASASSGNSIIGENMGLFIGGLPEDFFVFPGDTRLVRRGFSGCLRDISVKMSVSPAEEWEILDWKKATRKVGVYESWEGCPLQTVKGVHFLGDGYLELDTGVFSGGHNFDISMDFRTDQLSALLLFAYGTQTEDYMLVELEAGLLSFILASGGRATELRMWVGLSYCDGDWKQLSLAKRGSLISAAVGDWAEEMWEVGEPARLRVSSPLYLGGVPVELSHPGLNGQSHKHEICRTNINLSVAYRRSVRVNLDGCPTTESRFNCRGNDSVLVYTGRQTQATDYGLLPFTGNNVHFSFTCMLKIPTSVPPPAAVESISGFSAKVRWLPPTGDVRGLIDRYELKAYNKDHPEVPPITATYLANGNFTGLGVYSTNFLVLSACTKVGCTNSSQVTALTSELPPGPLRAPSLTLLDSRSILVEWSRPSQIDGVLKFYSVLLSSDGSEPILAYNSSDLAEEHTLRSLTPGTFYSVTVACTGGGCTRSPPSHVQTEESTPEDVPAPLVIPLSPHSLNISWTPPETPNGVITSYGLWMDGVLVFNSSSSQKFFIVEGLSPWSRHVVRLQACTAQGCGKGPLVESHTLEMAPEGPVLLELANQSSRSLRARWTAPPRANGNLRYSLYYKSKAPDGLSPVTLVSATNTSLNVSWSAPVNSNAPGPLLYSLHMRASPQSSIIRLLENATDTHSYYVECLSPFTNYLFRVVVSHIHGETAGPWATLRTAEDRPGPVDSPAIMGLQSRSALITWDPPAQTNGVITNYTLYLYSADASRSTPLSVTVPGNTTSYTFLNLHPYQMFSLQVKACTSAGCSVSGASQYFQTLPAPSEGVPAPHLYSDTPTSVLLSWGAPERSNGPLERWEIERRVAGTKQVSTVGRLLPVSPPLSFLDSSSALSPWTAYQYRLVLHNQLHICVHAGPWVSVKTRPSRPAGLSPPGVKVLGSESLQVTWSPPLIPNGEIHGYEIRLPEPRIFHNTSNPLEFNVTVTDLVPYTNYSISVLACSNGGGYVGGCTESLPTPASTLPTTPEDLAPLSVVPVSESFLAISWQPPSRPNGPNIRYKLLRRKTHQPLAVAMVPTLAATSPPPSEDLHRWFRVYSGTKLFYEDKGLSRFTRYQYQLVVYNDVGYSSGNIVTAVTMAGVPLKPPTLSARAINHTAVQVNWNKPSLQDLQGEVESFFLTVTSSETGPVMAYGPDVTSTVIGDLWPSTTYLVSLQVFNGAHNTTKSVVYVTTADGEPEGMSAPEVVPVNSSTARVLWFPPHRPNGAVTGYGVYVNGRLHGSVDNSSGSYLLGDLLPFTVYNIQVEVCTVYACTRSSITRTTTVEDLPADLPRPHAQVIMVRLDWAHPGRPSGIMLGYEVLRRTLRSCTDRSTGVTPCRFFYIEKSSKINFPPLYMHSCVKQICCNGFLHTRKPHHHCCDELYAGWDDSSHPVCCNGKLVPSQPNHQCCGRYYVPVKTNEYCCPDHLQGRVSVGPGDSCCGGVPYSMTGGQLCCSGRLHDGYGVQCCGGKIVDDVLVCCDDAVHAYKPGFICCGKEYINSSTSLCCVDDDGYPTIHPSGNATVKLQCCGSKVIHLDEKCCNGIGFDPQRHVCADQATPGLLMPVCFELKLVCPVAAAATSYCGSCDLDPSLTACTWVLTAHTHPDTQSIYFPLCCILDTDLEPFTTYEYRVRGWNSFGPGSTDVTTVTTSEDKPWGLAPPRWSRLGERNDIVQLQWQAPARPNGIITHYIVLRDGQERYRGDENTFTDVGGIGPFQEFVYQLRACNQAGCTDSTKVVAVTAQGVPEDVKPPAVKAISSSSLHVSWSVPSRPKGVIQRYQLNQTGVGTIFTHTGGLRNYTVTGLQPYTDYSFVLVACTTVGCAASEPSTGRTLQASPSGVWSSPRHLIINTSAVELYWDPPSQPNGHVFRYRLIRDGLLSYSFYSNLLPSSPNSSLSNFLFRYLYELEASTAGGTGLSDKYATQTPASCPTGIPPPYNLTVSGPHSLSLTWAPPAQLNSSQPVFYNVLLNPGSRGAMSRHAGQNLHLTVTDLEPFTTYYIRVQACQNEGCGVGDGVYIHTLEEIPEGLQPPTVKALGPSILEIHWTPPEKPNGLITSYHIYRRPLGTEEELLVFIWSTGPLEFVDASPALQPFSFFQYKVRAHNSKGSEASQWALAQTLQAKPQELAPPVVRPTGAYSVHLKWREPDQPNGLISHYRLVYMKHQQDPTLNSTSVTALTVKGSVLEAAVFGLDPFSQYSLRVEAVNGAGSVSSPWVEVQTLEASPTGLGNFTVEQREEGRALLLSWDEPLAPNGVITMYNLYSEENLEFSGLSRSFLFRRLEPWTVYSLTLEACTAAGCTLSPPQHITTAAAPPASQLPPRPLSVGADQVSLTWDPPSQPNGPIGEYSLLGRSLEERGKLRNNEEDPDGGKVEEILEAGALSYTVTGLRPWTQYEFSICTHNPAGQACSPWVTVTTRQAPPRGLASPTVRHVHGRPSEVVVSWTPPLEPNGVLQSYRIQRNNVNFKFSFDPTVLTYKDEDLHPFSTYSYSVTACTSEGCTTSPQTKIITLEAPPETVERPTVDAITSHHINVSWSKPLMQNGQVTEYVLKLNNKEAYRGRDLNAALSYLQPHTSYQLVLLACTRGGCTTSSTKTVVTEEAPPTHLAAPTLKVTGPESVEITWRPPDRPNGIITGYELRRDGEVIYIGRDTHYHDFTLMPSMEYSYVVRANNSKGAVSSEVATAKTHQSAPSGVGFPALTSLEVAVEWQTPARPNGDIVSYAVYLRDPVHLNVTSSVFTPEDSAFSDKRIILRGLFPYHRYEVRVEACTELGCSSSDWSSILTLEAPPADQPAPLLDLTSDPHTDLQTSFLLTWSPPGQSNGRILHYEVHRRQDSSETDETSSATVVYRNVSTSFKDGGLQPYTEYQYQVWAVNSAGYASSPWVSGRTGPAPPQGVGLPIFLDVSATSAVVNIHPPAQPNGIVSLFRVFSLDRTNITTLVLSEGTSHQQTLHGLRPYTQYLVGIEACTCYQCCSQGPVRELHTLAAPPADQPRPRLLTLTSRSVQMEWDEPTAPNGVIDSCELHIRTSCPQPPQPVPSACTEGPTEICFFGKHDISVFNCAGLQPYSAYELRTACFNKMGSTASNWTAVSTLSEPPQYVSPFSVDSNLTMIWLDWTETFSLNGFLKEYTVTESQLRVYTGFYSHLHIPRTSRKSEGPHGKHIHMLCNNVQPLKHNNSQVCPLEPVDGDKQGVSISATPVYSELWFILLFVLLGLFLLAILIGLLLRRYIHVKKNPSARERPPLVMLQKSRKAGGDAYKGLADTKIVSSSSRYSPMSVLRAPSQTDLTQAYPQHSLHRSVSQLIDRKSLIEEGCWDNPLGHDSGLYVEDDEFVDAIKALSSVKKEHSLFTDTHL